MKMARDQTGFSAHGGIRDVPRGAVPLNRVNPKPVPAPERRSHVGILLLVLVLLVGGIVSQNLQTIGSYISKPVRIVQMENSLQRVDEGDVRAILAAHLDAGYFGVDVRAIKAQLEANPWIEQATIIRMWPDTLSVAISEEVAIARWRESSLLNQYGESFEPNSLEHDMGLPRLNGPSGTERRVMEQYQLFSQMLLSTGQRIRELEFNERGSWSLVLNNDVQMTLGSNDVLERMQRFVTLYDRYLFNEFSLIETVDLRYNHGISIRKKPAMPDGVALK
jgi:cell division protein FtsQ